MDPKLHEASRRGAETPPYINPNPCRAGSPDPAVPRASDPCRAGSPDPAAPTDPSQAGSSDPGSLAPDPLWQPRIVAFFCNWCTYTAADLAGVSRLKYAPNARVIRLMCSGRVDPQFVLEAFARGADGVLLGGCHIGDCHYAEGNFKALRRITLLKRLLRELGIDERRLRLEWISASEGERVKIVINEMVEQVRALGPLGIPDRLAAWNKELAENARPVRHVDSVATAEGRAGPPGGPIPHPEEIGLLNDPVHDTPDLPDQASATGGQGRLGE